MTKIHTNKPQIKVGDVFKTNCYGDVEVIEYIGANKIKVRFKIDGYERYSTSGNLQKGKVKNPNIPTLEHKRRGGEGNAQIGDRFKNSKGYWYTLIGWTDAKNVRVIFDSGYEIVTTMQQVRNGSISDNFSPSFHEGYLGDLSYYSGINIAKTDEYKHWSGMIDRCFSPKFKAANPTYLNVSCCEEWLCFATFAEWCRGRKAYGSGIKLNLEKDVILKGNKIYSPEHCEMVPHQINGIFVKADISRGEYPIGVYFCNTNEKISACVREEGKNKFLGYFTNEIAAFEAYKKEKEAIIRRMTNKYKEYLPDSYITSLLNYKVEITD